LAFYSRIFSKQFLWQTKTGTAGAEKTANVVKLLISNKQVRQVAETMADKDRIITRTKDAEIINRARVMAATVEIAVTVVTDRSNAGESRLFII
jgi:hypothetical protein